MGLPAKKTLESTKKEKKRYVRKHEHLLNIIEKIKLWPSRLGILHGVKQIVLKGAYLEITTHCNHVILVKNSRKGRAARWLRNKWYAHSCPNCKVPEWKLRKFSATSFK